MADDDAPFEVEFLLGGGHVVPAKLYPDVLRQSRNPRTNVEANADGGSRSAAQGAAINVVRETLHKNKEVPIEVADGDTLWIIPTGTVMAARFRDPGPKGERSTFGFAPDRLGGDAVSE